MVIDNLESALERIEFLEAQNKKLLTRQTAKALEQLNSYQNAIRMNDTLTISNIARFAPEFRERMHEFFENEKIMVIGHAN